MVRKKQVNIQNRAVLNRDFPRRSRSLIIGADDLRRLFPNVKPEYIDLAIKRFGAYQFGDDENEIEVFGKILIAVIIQDALGTKEDGKPIYRYVYGKTQKEVLDKLHQRIEDYRGVELTEDSKMTLGEWLDSG